MGMVLKKNEFINLATNLIHCESDLFFSKAVF